MGIPQPTHPETIADIEWREDRFIGDSSRPHKECGCWLMKDGTWALCSYHDGFDEGVDLMKRALGRES